MIYDVLPDPLPPAIALTMVGREGWLGGDIPAVINGVLVRLSGSVEIEVIWWDGRVRKCEWVTPGEFRVKPA